MKFNTLCVHGEIDKNNTTGAISVPIYQSATFSHPNVGETTGYDYSRLQNPTRQVLEEVLTKLERGVDALAFSSGMAAINTLMELFQPNDHIIASEDLYGGAIRFFNHISKKHGITFDFLNTAYHTEIEKLLRPETKAIYIETPTNPMMHVTDIEAVSKIAKKHNLLLIVDNTFLSPYYLTPLSLGADIVMHSGTKYLCGHNDTLAGFLVVNSTELSERLRFLHKTTGSCLSPFDSWLLLRGIKTLSIRMDRQQESALKIAEFLSAHPNIKKVYYVGLPSHPQYEISLRQSTGFGSMISFEVDSEKTALNLLQKVKIISFAESLGGVESLITYPMLQTHADVPEQEREAKGINKCLLRLSVGIEDVEDLISDLTNALSI